MRHDARTQAAIDAGHPEWAELPASAPEARAAGEKNYFTGRPCKRGHIATRQVCQNCNECDRLYRARPEVVERQRRYTAQWHQENKAARMEQIATWESENRDRVRATSAKRRAAVRKACPSWVDHDALRAVYSRADSLTAKTGDVHHVDHIIPLVHPDVCGLHVPANLQVLTSDENYRKGNAFDGTHDNESWRK